MQQSQAGMGKSCKTIVMLLSELYSYYVSIEKTIKYSVRFNREKNLIEQGIWKPPMGQIQSRRATPLKYGHYGIRD